MQIFQFLAASRTDFLEQRNVFLDLLHLPGLNVKLAQILKRALVLGIEVERFFVEGIGLLTQKQPRPWLMAPACDQFLLDSGVAEFIPEFPVDLHYSGNKFAPPGVHLTRRSTTSFLKGWYELANDV